MVITGAAAVHDVIVYLTSIGEKLRGGKWLTYRQAASLTLIVAGVDEDEEHASFLTATQAYIRRRFGNSVKLDDIHCILEEKCGILLLPADRVHLANGLATFAKQPSQQLCLAPLTDATGSSGASASNPVPFDIAPYPGKDSDELMQIVASQAANIAKLKEDKYKQSQKVRRLTLKVDTLVEQVRDMHEEHSALVHETRYRVGERCAPPYHGYKLAIKRSFGHASAASTVQMVAGDEINGGLKDKSIVTKYENLACMAQRVRSKQEQNTAREISSSGMVPAPAARLDGVADGRGYSLHATSYGGDATKTATLHSEKIHLAELSTAACSSDDIADAEPLAPFFTRSLCDMQPVRAGTVAEFEGIIARQFNGVGCRTWKQSVDEAVVRLSVIAMFLFSWDQGPENVGIVPTIKESLASCLTVMFAVVWCLMHVFQLCTDRVLRVLNKFEFRSLGARALKEFVSGIKIIANTWRLTSRQKLIEAASKLYGDIVADTLYSKQIPRALPGRWLSCHTVAKDIDRRKESIGAVFNLIFNGAPGQKQKQRRTSTNGDDGEEDFQATLGRWRSIAVRLSTPRHFLAINEVACIGLGPLSHAMCYCQEKDGKWKAHRDKAERDNVAYVGETLVSGMVTGKAEEIRSEMALLLDDDEPDSPWAEVLGRFDDEGDRNDIMGLINSVVFCQICEWD